MTGKRKFLCPACGYTKQGQRGRSQICQQCRKETVMLTYEQAQACGRLSKSVRVSWWRKGGEVVRGPTRRKRWVAEL